MEGLKKEFENKLGYKIVENDKWNNIRQVDVAGLWQWIEEMLANQLESQVDVKIASIKKHIIWRLNFYKEKQDAIYSLDVIKELEHLEKMCSNFSD